MFLGISCSMIPEATRDLDFVLGRGATVTFQKNFNFQIHHLRVERIEGPEELKDSFEEYFWTEMTSLSRSYLIGSEDVAESSPLPEQENLMKKNEGLPSKNEEKMASNERDSQSIVEGELSVRLSAWREASPKYLLVEMTLRDRDTGVVLLKSATRYSGWEQATANSMRNFYQKRYRSTVPFQKSYSSFEQTEPFIHFIAFHSAEGILNACFQRKNEQKEKEEQIRSKNRKRVLYAEGS